MSKTTTKLPKATDHPRYAAAIAKRDGINAEIGKRHQELNQIGDQLRRHEQEKVDRIHAVRKNNPNPTNPIEAAALALLEGKAVKTPTTIQKLVDRRAELETEIKIHQIALELFAHGELATARREAQEKFCPAVWREQWKPLVHRAATALIEYHKARAELGRLYDALAEAELAVSPIEYPLPYETDRITDPNSNICLLVRELIESGYLSSRDPVLEGVSVK